MKPIIRYTFALTLILSFISCDKFTAPRRMKQMTGNIEVHFRDMDKENKTITTIKNITPISYEKVAIEDREDPNDEYLLKAYIQGYWQYSGEHSETDSTKIFLARSSRVFNMNDTIEVYFDKDYHFLRRKKN